MKITNFGLFIFIIISIVSYTFAAINRENSSKDEEYKKHCNNYCNHCGCMSFYCGEECICECSKDNNIEKDCITTVQNDAKKIKVPFEILIQGPNASKFLEDIEKYSHTSDATIIKSLRGKRSTVVIYRPMKSVIETEMAKIHKKIIEAKGDVIQKRQAEKSNY